MRRKAVTLIYILLLAAFSLEIAIRRFAFKQVPLDAPTVVVLAVLLLNGWVLVMLSRQVAPKARMTKTEKS
jgi:TRAP-type C4-dicarboxylate transport system permease small subunit